MLKTVARRFHVCCASIERPWTGVQSSPVLGTNEPASLGGPSSGRRWTCEPGRSNQAACFRELVAFGSANGWALAGWRPHVNPGGPPNRCGGSGGTSAWLVDATSPTAQTGGGSSPAPPAGELVSCASEEPNMLSSAADSAVRASRSMSAAGASASAVSTTASPARAPSVAVESLHGGRAVLGSLRQTLGSSRHQSGRVCYPLCCRVWLAAGHWAASRQPPRRRRRSAPTASCAAARSHQ